MSTYSCHVLVLEIHLVNHFSFMEAVVDAMETERDAAEAIPVVTEVQHEFERLRQHFPCLSYRDCGQLARWQLRGLSPLNLDINITFQFVEINETMIAGSGKASLNAYVSSDPASLSVMPSVINALTPRWTLCVGENARVHSYDGELSASGMLTAVARLMSMQASDDNSMLDDTPLTYRARKEQRLQGDEDPVFFDHNNMFD